MRVIEVSAQSEGRKERDLGLEDVLNGLDELTIFCGELEYESNE